MNKQVPDFPSVCWLVEDSIEDTMLLKMAISTSHPSVEVIVSTSGEVALREIAQRNLAGLPSPVLMIVDVNLPGMKGFDFLGFLIAGGFKKFPVIMMSGSTIQKEEATSMASGADGFLEKSMSFYQMEERLGQMIEDLLPRQSV